MHVLSIGSSVVDLFLTVDSDFVKTENGRVSFNLGDKVPSDIKSMGLGGNGANIAVGLTRLEIPTSFYTYLGNDSLSREIEETLSREGVELAAPRGLIKNAPLHIILDFSEDRVILSHYEDVDHSFELKKDQYFDFVFLNSIAAKWESAYTKVLAYVKENNIPLAFSPGSRQLENLNETVREIIATSQIFFSNREEAMKILNRESESNIKDLLSSIKQLGPKIVSITDGSNGAYAIDENSNCYFIKPAASQGTEKTGAGDAYATGFCAAILHGQDVPQAMACGATEASAVLEQVGAQKGLLSSSELDKRLTSDNNLKAEKI